MTEAIAPELMRVREAAAYMGISLSKAWAMIWAGELPSVRIGARSVRVPRAALEAWLQAHTVGAA